MILKSILLLIFAITSAHAEIRIWRSSDGSKNFQGEFVKQTADQVTIRNQAGKELNFPAAKLHADDLIWISDQLRKAAAEAGVFGGIRFGETEAKLHERLKTNPHIVMPKRGEISDQLVGAKTKLKLGEETASVSFGWALHKNIKNLSSFNITCKPQTASSYDGPLKSSLDDMAALLISIHGKPTTTAPYPARGTLKENVLSPSNSWTFPDGSTLEAGVALCQDGHYVAVASFSHPPL